MRAYRLVKADYAPEAFSGRGAALRGGRWNPKGVPAVYASEHLALSVLEWLAYALEVASLESYVYFRLEVPSSEVVRAEIPPNWRALPHPPETQEVGRRLLVEEGALAFLVPSVLVPEGWNLVLNPKHPAFHLVEVEGPFSLVWDPRVEELVRRARG
ncbi:MULTISPECIES: RES family NAD+ phosphorylase [Thermus]|uniref:RES family NAD+ phosphorylase n=1 Tax=Thermus TaxID=270 RepID=UPI001F2DB824|nr:MULTISPECIES: RES family NAD+ phosphorylase [Thermus]